MISMLVFSLLVGGILSANIFGLKMCEITKNKLERGLQARAVIGNLAAEVRSARAVLVGSVANGVFSATLAGQPQTGNALAIFPTTNDTTFIIYFLNPNSTNESFRRFTSASTTPVELASSVTNSPIFTMEDYAGNPLTTWKGQVVKIKLEFFQARGLAPDAEYFKLETAMARRAIE